MDTSVYDAACRLSLDYIMRYPIIDGQGSFGSTDGDGAAAMRYTEMRPSKIMELITEDVKKNTDNFAILLVNKMEVKCPYSHLVTNLLSLLRYVNDCPQLYTHIHY